MIKFFFILRKKPGITKEEFHAYWKNVHAPLVAKLPGLVRYTQHHVTTIPRPEYEQVEDPVDGIVETWWESQEALERVQKTPEFLAVVQDEPNFIRHSDHHIQTVIVTESVEVVGTNS